MKNTTTAETKKRYYEKNKDVILQKQKIYRLEHPEISRNSARRRRTRLMKSEVEFYTEKEVLEKYGTDCHICNEPIDLTAPRWTGHYRWKKSLHIDHLIPISLGGSDTLENVRPAHGFCNVSKGAKIKEG